MNSGTPNNRGIQIIQIMVDPVSYKINTTKETVCSASSYTKRRRVKWKLHLTNCDARDTGQMCANTERRISPSHSAGASVAVPGSYKACNFHGNLNGGFHGSFNDNPMETSMTASMTASMAISMANSTAVTMETSTTVCMTAPMTISMTNDNYKDIYMHNDRDKDKFKDNDNGSDNNNASQFNDKCNINTDDNDTGNYSQQGYIIASKDTDYDNYEESDKVTDIGIQISDNHTINRNYNDKKSSLISRGKLKQGPEGGQRRASPPPK